VSLICGFRTEREKACFDTAMSVVARGSASSSRNCEALSTVARRAGGPVRSSEEAPVIGVERRGRTIRAAWRVNRRRSGGTR
jgi:hypothetical protein